MGTILPIFLVCVLPMIWTALVFALGRWSVKYGVYRRDLPGPTPAYDSPYRDFYQQESR